MNIIADMHAHTIPSGHAYSTLSDIKFPEEPVLSADADKLRRYFKDKKGIDI